MKSSQNKLTYCELFDWVKLTIEENDAGFPYIMKIKGRSTYNKHCKSIRAKIEQVEDIDSAVKLYQEWLTYFRKNHLGVQLNQLPARTPALAASIPPRDDWEKVDITENELRMKLSHNEVAGFEGIWVSEPYTIGIYKKGDEYIGFIIDAPGTPWQAQQVKLKLIPKDFGGGYKAIAFLRDYSSYETDDLSLWGSNHLSIGFIKYKRLYPSYANDENVLFHMEMMETRVPILKELSPDTIFIRLPSFNPMFREDVENLISSNSAKLGAVRNLIIDVRNNGGGSTECFKSLIPYLYTNPIRYIGWEFRSTKLNMKKFKEWGMFEAEDNTPEGMKQAKALYKMAKSNLGGFVDFSTEEFLTTKMVSVMEHPKQIAIIMNEGCASATESFLILAKQSLKTKLFGRSSEGCYDISNMNSILSPCKRIMLRYAMTITRGFPEAAIDKIGIQPDFYIARDIPEYKWIGYVSDLLGKDE